MVKNHIPLPKALMIIFLSTLLISGSAAISWSIYAYQQSKHFVDHNYNVSAITQTGPYKNALPTTYLAEIMGLSLDQPINLYRFNTTIAERNLEYSPVISEAKVEKYFPSTVYVDYIVRSPIATLGDYFNAAIDKEGIIFPLSPYLTPKNIPEIYLGIADQLSNWESSIDYSKFVLAKDVMEMLFESHLYGEFEIKRIDVSLVDAGSAGERQIVVKLKDQGQTRLLRFNVRSYRQEFKKYLLLRDDFPAKHQNQNCIIDFRVPKLAFIEPLSG
ncbi:MAG: cell division protein FtsQ/DivIB [Chlamydiota bacterium]